MKNRLYYKLVDGSWHGLNARKNWEFGHPYRKASPNRQHAAWSLVGEDCALSFEAWSTTADPQRSTLGRIVFKLEMKEQ